MRRTLAWFYGLGVVVSSSWLSNGANLLKENIFKLFIQFKHYKRYVCMHECNHIRAHQLKMVGYDEFLSYDEYLSDLWLWLYFNLFY